MLLKNANSDLVAGLGFALAPAPHAPAVGAQNALGADELAYAGAAPEQAGARHDAADRDAAPAAPSAGKRTFYQWTDERGSVRFARSLDDVPAEWRARAGQIEVDSAAFVYAEAEWHEREILDLLGVRFRSHPDPRRILMTDDYPGHPLRKDFPMDTPWGYRPATPSTPPEGDA